MILSNAPVNEAVLSNVGAIGEFRIRNSAKAFSILSSGLYANKIRAIIRELSCNAIDAHVAAGTQDRPYEVHLPTALEPHFAIRDYGTGLSHEQVTQIYTTYFESTKTGSNDFIGALGLGSKSPFSYTDNFTVTATQNGVRGIYTAFISDTGVPSIALMYKEPTLEDNGVEVRFAVTERYDFGKFRDEARAVYKHFSYRPTITGLTNFEFEDPQYETQNIIPGVHSGSGGNRSIALMGNIAYPIEVPNPEQLGDLGPLLQCGLTMEFDIGELDFQASREGLSYIPQTIEAIKRKLEAVNGALTTVLAADADAIDNLWARAIYLNKKRDTYLWKAAVDRYVDDTDFPLANRDGNSRWDFLYTFKLNTTDLRDKYNIVIRAFSRSRHAASCSNLKADNHHDRVTQKVTSEWRIRVDSDNYFVFNDTKIGALERAKHDWRKRNMTSYTDRVYVIEPADRTKPIKRTQFLASIHNPPADRVLMASALLEKERASGKLGKNVTILHLEERQRSYYNRNTDLVWADAGTADSFDATKTYYYLPLSGFRSLGRVEDIKDLRNQLKRSKIHSGEVYGVRKSNIDWIKTQTNWVNLDDFVTGELNKMGQSSIMEVVKQAIGFNEYFQYKDAVINMDANSPYAKLYAEFKDVKDIDTDIRHSVEYLCREYQINTATNVEPTQLIADYRERVASIKKRYPLLSAISKWSANEDDVADYIRMVDATKPV
jgi:hypothetical protein